MKIEAICEYNRDGYLIFAENYPGAYVRGITENEALAKFGGEIRGYLRWNGTENPSLDAPEIHVTQRFLSDAQVCDADSRVLFESEKLPLSEQAYQNMKLLVLKSARDFNKLFESIPNPDISGRPHRSTFYGPVPRTPREMYEHTNLMTSCYTAAFGLKTENVPDIYVNRLQALSDLEDLPDFLSGKIYTAPNGEEWTIRKILRRFLWHDRIHAKAIWRTAYALWADSIENPFYFI